ncbi:MAG: cytochrome c biogenesis protein CcsA [Bdellovibrionota bacterium]|nr:MAG: cytochrome c biogenesis protein CcsA [Bdellovibrionota bacterium]
MSLASQSPSAPASSTVERAIVSVALLALLLANALVFLYVPNEKFMGPVQRILYFHAGSATATYIAIFTVFVSGVWYLATRDGRADALGHAASEVAFTLCTVVMLTGMIWGEAAWNTMFRMEPRLVSFLFLWLLLLSLVALRRFGAGGSVQSHCAVLGIIAALTVPLVVYSIQLLPQVAQLHPQVVAQGGLKEPAFNQTLAVSMVALTLFSGVLIYLQMRVKLLETEVRRLAMVCK